MQAPLAQRQCVHTRQQWGSASHHHQQCSGSQLRLAAAPLGSSLRQQLNRQRCSIGSGCVARSVPEKTQEQQQLGSSIEQNGAPAEPPHRQFITADAMTTMQEEQEKELKAMTSDIPVREQRFEWLAFWVAAAVAFGAGIWWVVLEPLLAADTAAGTLAVLSAVGSCMWTCVQSSCRKHCAELSSAILRCALYSCASPPTCSCLVCALAGLAQRILITVSNECPFSCVRAEHTSVHTMKHRISIRLFSNSCVVW